MKNTILAGVGVLGLVQGSIAWGLMPLQAGVSVRPTVDYIVSFKNDVSAEERRRLHEKVGAEVDTSAKLLPNMDLVRLANVSEALKEYSASSVVKYVSENYRVHRALAPVKVEKSLAPFSGETSPSDPYLSRQWAFQAGGYSRIAEAWELTRGISTVTVGVVDTGLQMNHEDLAENVWVNPGEIPGNNIDDDGNGYVDDVYGYDMIDRRPLASDAHGHGTHVSGTIGARTNNGKGVAGINWDIKIIGVRAVPSDGDETDAHVIESFLYQARNGARVVNCSFGKAQSSLAVNETIESLKDSVLFVVAAGNDGKDNDKSPSYPAAFPAENILTVAALGSSAHLTWWSNYGEKTVDLAAPGDAIWSTVRGSSYSSMSGTSMATPHVAGAAALVLSVAPHLKPIEVKEILMASGDARPDLKTKVLSGRSMNVEAAVKMALGTTQP